jgi:uncharacterized protein YjbI with pentapeptide repeats
MTSSDELPSKADLERRQLQLSNEKLMIETKKLQSETIPEKWWSKLIKNVVAAGGVIAVVSTIYGLWDSYSKTIVDRERARSVEQRTQFEDAIKKFEASNTISKLVGVSILSGHLKRDSSAYHRQVLFAFASLVATEKDLQTQAAVADLISAQENDVISKDDWAYFQEILVSQSRALMTKGQLYERRQFGRETVKPSDDELAARNIGRLIAITVRKGVVPQYSKYRGIYCESCDFHNGRFPKGVDFTGSVLDRANFRGATLQDASFDNADMGGAIFAEAFLKGASFRTLSARGLIDGISTEEKDFSSTRLLSPFLIHVHSALETEAVLTIVMPDFSCANLQNARFDNLALFPIRSRATRLYAPTDESAKDAWRLTVPSFIKDAAAKEGSKEFDYFRTTPPSFYRADLRGTNFESMRYFLLVGADQDHHIWQRGFSGGTDLYEGTILKRMFERSMEDDGVTPKPVSQTDGKAMDRSDLQDDLRIAFYRATVDETSRLPPGVADFIKTKPSPMADFRRWFQSVFRSNSELDWNCVPRERP